MRSGQRWWYGGGYIKTADGELVLMVQIVCSATMASGMMENIHGDAWLECCESDMQYLHRTDVFPLQLTYCRVQAELLWLLPRDEMGIPKSLVIFQWGSCTGG